MIALQHIVTLIWSACPHLADVLLLKFQTSAFCVCVCVCWGGGGFLMGVGLILLLGSFPVVE